MCPAMAPRRIAKHCETLGRSGERNRWSTTLSAQSSWSGRAPDQTHNPWSEVQVLPAPQFGLASGLLHLDCRLGASVVLPNRPLQSLLSAVFVPCYSYCLPVLPKRGRFRPSRLRGRLENSDLNRAPHTLYQSVSVSMSRLMLLMLRSIAVAMEPSMESSIAGMSAVIVSFVTLGSSDSKLARPRISMGPS